MVSDLVARQVCVDASSRASSLEEASRQVCVDASSREEALENANYGKWRLPEDVEHEEVVDRQAVEILTEYEQTENKEHE